MMSKNWELHAVVSGRVQKVGFRATTKRLADALHLVGTVRNLSDGTVATALKALGRRCNSF